ncbi:hypothetical protein NQZ79_g6593 [Umbelopsis isabellina]|nr:hypothetical protein NQZ79_g6593 [Umbelopsis isabellina]
MLALAISGAILIIIFTYAYQLIDRFETGASTVDPEIPYFKESKILLVTAHPDDECMFFGPTLTNLSAKRLKNEIHVLCLSKGDAEKLGSLRKRELVKSCQVLGVPSNHVKTIDNPDLPDSMTVEWNAALVAKFINEYASKHGIQIIITFDEQGVSGHTNHKAAYHGAVQYIRSLADSSVQLYKLPTVTLARKYIGLGDLPLAVTSHFMTTKSKENDASRRILFISSPAQYLIAHRAMRQHVTQLVWFRWLYVIFSRYMVINELIMVPV